MRPLLTIRVPGKVLLTGEYAVLDGAPAIAAAVSRFVTCRAVPAGTFEISGAGAFWREGGAEVPELSFACEALRIARLYVQGIGAQLPAVRLELTDDLRAPDGQKLGLGGSACVCAAVVSAVLGLAAAPLDPGREKGLQRTFQLAACAHVGAQGKMGSSVDVAASVFRGVIQTQKFDAAPLNSAASQGAAAFARAVDEAPIHPIRHLPAPERLLLLFGGRSASTPVHVASVKEAARRHPDEWRIFVKESAAATWALAQALGAKDHAGILQSVERSFAALDAFAPLTGIEITPARHRQFREAARRMGAAAKPSGAGGGDVAYAVGDGPSLERLLEHLEASENVAFMADIVPPEPLAGAPHPAQ